MSSASEIPVAMVGSTSIEWPAVIAGAVVAAGISFALLAFGSGIGLSVVSTAPTWRDSSPWLWLLSGLFLVFVTLCSFGFGGYIAGRARLPLGVEATEEVEYRDGLHGIVTWGLAILITAVLALAGAAMLVPAATPGGARLGPATSVAGENIIATELDELFREARDANIDSLAYHRAEAARILLKSSGHQGVGGEDRAHLASMVAKQAGLAQADAADRADRAIRTSALEIRRARQAAVMQAFMIGVALVLGAAIAWLSACEGGRDRQRRTFPTWRRRIVRTA